MELHSSTPVEEITESGVIVMSNAVTSISQDVVSANHELFTLRQDESRALQNHFSRPYRLSTTILSGDLMAYYQPLYDYLSSPRNADRIRGYSYLHATLHIKAVINAPARSSGATIVALHPWPTRDGGIGELNGTGIVTSLNITQMSCLPHIIVDYSNEAGGEISCPIITPTNGLNILSAEQVRSCFLLHVHTFVVPQIDAGDAGAKPTLTLFAWLTDVKLSAPTLRLELQSDEYAIHPKDQPGTIKVAFKSAMHKVLDNVKGFATDLAVSSIYAAVGLSKPISTDPHVQHVPRTIGLLSNFNGMESIPRLSGDIKQEVKIDSEHLGYSSCDEMDLLNIAQKEAIAWWVSFPTDGSPFPIPYTIPVSPTMCNAGTVLSTGVSTFIPTPMAFAALPFSKWRGTIKIRFKVICSAFARGKIRITHDPHWNDGDSDLTFSRLNAVIWDISQSKECVIHVPWVSNLPFKPVPLLHPAISTALIVGTNGYLSFTNITSIIDPGMDFIAVIIMPSAGEDMVFGDLRPALANYTFAGVSSTFTAAPRSLEVMDEEVDSSVTIDNPFGFPNAIEDQDSADLANSFLFSNPPSMELQSYVQDYSGDGAIMTGDKQGSILEVNIAGISTTPADSNEMLAVCIGEKYTNIRQIIKRYTHTMTRRINSSLNESFYTLNLPDRPVMKGWQGTASLNVDPGGALVTYARDSYLSYFLTGFLGYRGGINNKYIVKTINPGTSSITASRSSPGYLDGIIGLTTSTSASAFASDILQYADTRAGAAQVNLSENSAIEFNTPYYSTAKFNWAQDRTPQLVRSTLDRGYDTGWHNISVNTYNGSASSIRVDRYVAAADDFTMFMFLYPPVMLTTSPTRFT